ncbi:MAG: hypothetical protein ACT4QF_03750 [Sporichthyaceae bacterium]
MSAVSGRAQLEPPTPTPTASSALSPGADLGAGLDPLAAATPTGSATPTVSPSPTVSSVPASSVPAPVPASTTTSSPTAIPVDSSKVEAGVIGLIFFVVMGAVVVALVMSMRKHLNRVDVNRHARSRAPQPPTPGTGPGGTV